MTERGDLRGGETEKKQRDRQTYEAGEVRRGQREYKKTKGEGEERRDRVSRFGGSSVSHQPTLTRVSDSQIKKTKWCYNERRKCVSVPMRSQQ